MASVRWKINAPGRVNDGKDLVLDTDVVDFLINHNGLLLIDGQLYTVVGKNIKIQYPLESAPQTVGTGSSLDLK